MAGSVNKRDIAIIGMSGRFPRSRDLREFWKHLMGGEELVHFYEDKELIDMGVSESIVKTPNYVKVASLIEEAGAFDFSFFGYTPDEAAMMNPQTRLFHQHAWTALEDAGCNIYDYQKKVGVFVGANNDLNWSVHTHSSPSENVDPFFLSKIANPNYMGSLLAYKLNLKGPCYFSDTACSTSLTASHMACRSLLMNECSMAIAGGVKIFSTNNTGYYYHKGAIMSEDGHCRAFDAEASGTIGGEGIGVIVLKRLSDALEDGDAIYAVIKGSAVNNDGDRKASYTMPSVEGQVECIRMAQRIANVTPDSVSYIEAHGTATKIGDPIEVAALNQAFKGSEQKCAIGSVKTNMGHLDEAAGVAGLIKTALALHRKELPASINFKTPNPLIDFAAGPFFVQASSGKWNRNNGSPLRAGINSFGVGGTNVHMVLEEAPVSVDKTAKNEKESYHLISFSAKNEEALAAYQQDLLSFLKEEEVSMRNMAYTLQKGRVHFDYRSYVLASNQNELIENLNGQLTKTLLSADRELVFMFSGQGSQYFNMGKGLYEENTVFRQHMDEGFRLLKELTGEDYQGILYGNEGEDTAKVNHTQYTQPLLFVFEYALAQLFLALNVRPTCMIGHSLGEYVAACISGVFSFEDGVKLILKRATLMGGVPKGDMLSIALPYNTVDKQLIEGLAVAAINSPSSFVVSGTEKAIAELQGRLKANEVPHVPLKTSHAFHSSMMNEIVADFQQVLEEVEFSAPKLPFISNLSGELITAEEATSPEYWLKHMLETVHFQKGIQTLLRRSNAFFLEIGPGRTLSTFCRQCAVELKEKNLAVSNSIRHVKEEIPDTKHLLQSIGAMWSNGINIDWDLYYEGKQANKVALPTYPFRKDIFPVKVDAYASMRQSGVLNEGRKDLADWFYLTSWKETFLEEQTAEAKSIESVVFFSQGDTHSQALIKALEASGAKVLEVQEGEESHFGGDVLTVNPHKKEDLRQLSEQLRDRGNRPDTILYGWSTGKMSYEKSAESLYEENKHLRTLLNLLSAFDSYKSSEETALVILTTDQFNATGVYQLGEYAAVMQSALLVLSQEYPHIQTTIIDYESAAEKESMSLLTSNEVLLNQRDALISFRNGKRWIPSYTNIQLPKSEPGRKIKSGGNVLITGGLGQLGTALAEYLIKEHNARILLLGREDLSEADKSHKKKRRLLSLEQLGEVHYQACDVADYDALLKTVLSFEGEYGNFSGLIHAAGNTDLTTYTTLDKLDEAAFNNHFDSKVRGLLNLYELFGARNLDFARISSSLSIILGGLSYGCYAAANHFMEAFIQRRQKELANWQVLCLDGISSLDDEFISTRELVQVFTASFGTSVPQLIVSTRNLHQALRQLDKQISGESTAASYAVERPNLSVAFSEANTEIEHKVKAIWEKLFGIDGIGVLDDFFELGGDSLKGIRLLQGIESEFEISLSIEELFSAKTIKNIAQVIEDRFAEPEVLPSDLKEFKELTI
jgi:acyl transferase domain-containing protein/acyl carrier protein